MRKKALLGALGAGLLVLLVLLTHDLWAPAEQVAPGRGPLAAGENGPAQPGVNFKDYQPGRGRGTAARVGGVDLHGLKPQPNDAGAPKDAEEHVESKLTEAQFVAALEYAKKLPPTSGVRAPMSALVTALPVRGFPGPDATECCANTGHGAMTPPDPDLAVGPNHILAVVNVAFKIYDRSGALLAGPISFPNLWQANASGSLCTGINQAGFFDPFVAYDAQSDRWVLGIDGQNSNNQISRFCLAVSATGDPTGNWNLYAINANDNLSTSWADYPHMAVWNDKVYLSANYFTFANSYMGARVYALDKAAMYGGGSVSFSYHDTPTGGDGTPWDTLQPAKPNWKGMIPGGPEYFLSAAYCASPLTCNLFGIFRWDDPFGANNLVLAGQAQVTTYAAPPSAAQTSSEGLATNDWRMLDAKWAPDGTLYGAHTIGCNPGAGSVACVHWAQVTLAGTLVQEGVIASNGVHRYFPSLAVDRAGDMHISYTRSSGSENPGVVFASRLQSDPAGMVGPETLAKAGELAYTSISFDPPPHRWGDYTGLAIDPVGGCQAYNLGEYAKNINALTHWGTWVQTMILPNCTAVNLPVIRKTSP